MVDVPMLTFRRGIHYVLTLQSLSEQKEICVFGDEKGPLLEKLNRARLNEPVHNGPNDRIIVRREDDEVVVSEHTGDRWQTTRHSVAECDEIVKRAMKEML